RWGADRYGGLALPGRYGRDTSGDRRIHRRSDGERGDIDQPAADDSRVESGIGNGRPAGPHADSHGDELRVWLGGAVERRESADDVRVGDAADGGDLDSGPGDGRDAAGDRLRPRARRWDVESADLHDHEPGAGDDGAESQFGNGGRAGVHADGDGD